MKRPPGTRAWKNSGAWFVLPWFVGFFGLLLVPMIASLLLSFVQWDGLSLHTIRWVGTDNYRRIFTDDPNVPIALWNTFVYGFVAVPLGLCVSLALAVLLNQRVRGIAVFRTIFYLPNVIAGVATIVMWAWIFNPDFGLLNAFLRDLFGFLARLGVPGAENWAPPDWLLSPRWSKPALIIMSLWGAGGAMLIFLAALQNVPQQLYEAARIDGAGAWRQFLSITVPQVTPAIFFNLVMGIIGSFQVFTQAYLMTAGGPQKSTLFYVLYLYNRAFQDFQMGYASALAWVLFVIILVFTLMVVRSGKLWVHYEGG